ncbi:transposase family protein, partial [uncultured Nostoc sp.]|uniref:transposase family protein n=1 Tax=uncultured Nostoc sp. TaxID=340711 RepID=UPI0035C985ED
MDVTESQIERPKHGQKRFYSGKQKRHTLKSQLIIDLTTQEIRCIVNGSGRKHDYKLFVDNPSCQLQNQTGELVSKR